LTRKKDRKTPDQEGAPTAPAVDEATAPIGFENRAVLQFPVIGMGASAGGIEAVSRFFQNMPHDSGMAFVLIQHLPPERESFVAEILSRKTSMPVKQVEDGMRVERNTVYVIRPGHTLTLEEGQLRLGDSVEKKGHRRPVDDFFRSVAAEQKEKSIVVILSGMGSNGSAGAQAIKAAGGIVIAQDPETAEFPSMPRTVIHAGYADYVAPPEAIPEMLLNYSRHPYYSEDGYAREQAETALQRERHHFTEILAILRAVTGRDYSGYKKPTLLRRIQRRMGLAQVTTLHDYVGVLRSQAEEVQGLNTDLTINVTGFFRDTQAWEALRAQVLQSMFEERDNTSQLRAWVAGCASGEEAYTLAMLIAEEADRQRKHFDVKIFATDTAEKTLGHARAGIFPAGIEGDVSAERLDRFFERDDHSYKVRKEIREMVVFAPQNLLTDPPFSRLDLCTCRNLLIYLEPATQRRVISLLHFSLKEDGTLFLGNSETVGQAEDLFEPIDRKWRLYRRLGPTRHELLRTNLAVAGGAITAPIADLVPAERPGVALLIQRAVNENHGPAFVVIDDRERAVYFQGRTDRYLAHPAGEPTRNIVEMTRDPLRGAARAAVREAMTQQRLVRSQDIASLTAGRPHRVNISVAPLGDARVDDHYVVTFEEAANRGAVAGGAEEAVESAGRDKKGKKAGRQARKDDVLEAQLHSVREELQSTIEELEASNEELKASNEEVTSINEELQSTNEELETSKEELQSLNEELTTVNSQLQAKIEELEGTTNDLTNLLSSTDIAVVFLDTALRIRRFTPAMKDLLELIPSDIGRPVMHLAQKFEGPNIIKAAQSVLEKLIPVESEIRSHSAHWYACRALPYRTQDNRIDGVVLTFVDITERKHAEQVVRDAQMRLQAAVEQLPAAVLIAEAPSGRLVLANHQAAVLFGHPYPLPFLESEWAAAYVAFKGLHASGRPYQRDDWPLARSLKTGETVSDEEIRFVRPDGSSGTMSASSVPVRDNNGTLLGAVATFWDISERSQADSLLRESEQRFRLVVEGAKDYAIIMLDPEGKIITWNSGAQKVFGHQSQEAIGQSHRILYRRQDQSSGMPERRLKHALVEREYSEDEICLVRKDGTEFWASGMLASLLAASGQHHGYLLLVQDITESRRVQVGLQHAKNEAETLRDTAEAASRAKDDFVATVSHELRTPLTAILLWARMLKDSALKKSDMMEGISTIERAARAQQQLVDDLLDVSRIASGKLRLALRATPLQAVIEAALDAVKPAAEARGVALQADVSHEIGTVRADPDRVQQIVWNLLSNAVKFTPSGGRARLTATREGTAVVINVSDNGIGIAPSLMPQVFDRFKQGHVGTTREHSGLGLGLSIARQLAELHGGTLTGESAGEGKGATFAARLPLPAIRMDGEKPRPAPVDGVDLKGRNILLVEDEEISRDAIKTFLRVAGANVVAAESGGAGLQAVAKGKFDVIVADIAMPGMDGYEFLRQVRRQEKTNGHGVTPSLALSAFARPEDQRKATEAGFHAYLVKPVEAERLVAVLDGLIRKA